MVVSLIAAAAILAAGAPPAEPAPGATPAASAATKAGPKPDEVVCRREPVLGSRMKQRLCMTQADWDARKATARDELEKAQTNQTIK